MNPFNIKDWNSSLKKKCEVLSLVEGSIYINTDIFKYCTTL